MSDDKILFTVKDGDLIIKHILMDGHEYVVTTTSAGAFVSKRHCENCSKCNPPQESVLEGVIKIGGMIRSLFKKKY